jgi:hypothetical protein
LSTRAGKAQESTRRLRGMKIVHEREAPSLVLFSCHMRYVEGVRNPLLRLEHVKTV